MASSDPDRTSPLLLARICGLVALAGIVAGAFDIGYIRNTLIIEGDAPATIHNILAHERLFRLGFGAHLFEMLLNIVGEILFFFLLRRVNRIVAAIVLACGLIGTAIESLDLLNAYVPFVLAVNANTLGTFTAQQLQSLSYIFVRMQDAGLVISFAFYGVNELLSGFLIFRSGFLPRVIGVLLGISGFCYFTHSFLTFVAPSLGARVYPYILYACLPGEASIALWMSTVGLNVENWKAWTPAPQPELALAD